MLVVKLVRSCGNCVETQDGSCIGGKSLGFVFVLVYIGGKSLGFVFFLETNQECN